MKDTDSQFSPSAILKASGNRFSDAATKQLDRAQGGDRPSDFGDHEPISEEAMVQFSLGPQDLSASKVEIPPLIDGSVWDSFSLIGGKER